MKKLIMFNMMSLDGFFEGLHNELDWHNVDSEFNDFALQQLDESDMLFFGRKTYNMMASYWPTAPADDPVAVRMNKMQKVVFSKKSGNVEWENSSLVNDNVFEKVTHFKNQGGKDILLFGSSDLCYSLMQKNLVDELRIMINPLILGSGKPLFPFSKERINLELTGTRVFNSGNVLLSYRQVI